MEGELHSLGRRSTAFFCSAVGLLRSPGPRHGCLLFTSAAIQTAPLCNDHFLPRRLLGPATRHTQEMDSNPRMGNRRWIFHNSLLKQGRGFRINSRLHREAADAITMGPVPRALCPPLQEGSRNTWETTAPSTLILPQGEASRADSRLLCFGLSSQR